ncbi:MAG: outer membrane protein assembly factor BamA [Oligoflexia bacterium]|nr:outer membrane protein assembly factor BamA [Oligoflexia bacterium]
MNDSSARNSVLFLLIGFWLFLLSPLALLAEESYSVSGVLIEGNRNVDTDAIKMQLKHRSGQVSAADISDDVKNLYNTEFFEQVSASVVPSGTSAGTSVVKYSLIEKPLVRKTFIKGNDEVSESDLSPILSLGPKRFMDRSKVEALIRAATSYYQKQGFYDAKIEYSVVPSSDGQVDITFSVDEGKRVKIRKIKVEGLKEIDSSDLLSSIETRRYKWWNSWLTGTGRLNKDMLDNDKTIMRQYFLDHGYVEGSVSEPAIERRADGLYITFFATEGKLYKFGKIAVTGDLIDGSEQATLADLKSVGGETFSAASLREDTFKVSDKFADRGFAFVNVVPDTNLNREASLVDITFNVNKGKEVTINRVNIHGNTKTYDNVIRRELTLDEQERYSSSKLRRSQQLLQRLGYFEEATVSTSPAETDDKVNMDVNVREGSTGSFSIGAGYSTSEGALFNSRLAENNLFGTGRSASLNVDVGTQRENYVLSVNDRRFMDSYVSLGADALRTKREYSDFDRTLSGGSLSAGYPLDKIFGEWAEDFDFSTKYEYLDININNVDVQDAAQLVIDSQGTSTASSITPRLVRNALNNTLDPTDGSMQDLSVELAGLGGDQQFYLAEFRNGYYQPLFGMGNGQLVFSWRFRVGYGESWTSDPFPLYQRYFPGGINSVRGYKARTLGPKDERGNEFGGSKEMINNAELIFPLVTAAGLKAVVFYDAGQAFDDDKAMAFEDLRQAYGYGLRWSSPVGPIRIEFGFPIDRQDGESSMITNFSFGAPF